MMKPVIVDAMMMAPRRALGQDEEKAVHECIAFYRDIGRDPGYQEEFERRYTEAFCRSQGGGYADAVATGTAAVFIAIQALDLHKGSSILVSPITDPGTVSAIILAGHYPVLMDSEPDTACVSADSFCEAFRKDEVQAAVVVHPLGRAVDMPPLMKVANAYNIWVVEDCSQAHGARVAGHPVGTFGHIAAFSTMFRKAHITGGSGGVVYTKDEDLYHLALAHADRGKPRWSDSYDGRDPRGFLFPALNLHTDEISCAIGCASLARLGTTIAKRLEFVAEFAGRLRDRSRCCSVEYSPNDSPFVLPVMVRGRNAEEFARALRDLGVPLNPHYQYLIADWPWAKPYLRGATPNARKFVDTHFMLYLNENYGIKEAETIIKAIVKVEKEG